MLCFSPWKRVHAAAVLWWNQKLQNIYNKALKTLAVDLLLNSDWLHTVQLGHVCSFYAHIIASCTYGSSRLMWCHHSNCGSSSTSHHSSSPSQSCSCLQYSIQYGQLLHSLWPGVWLPALVLGHCWLGRAGFVPLQPLYYPNLPSLQNLKQEMIAINMLMLEWCTQTSWLAKL